MLPAPRSPKTTAISSAGSRASRHRPVRAFAAFGGVSDDTERDLAQHRSRRNSSHQNAPPALSAPFRAGLLFFFSPSAHLAAAGASWPCQHPVRPVRRTQFRLIPRHADADDSLELLYLSVRLLAHCTGHPLLSRPDEPLGRARRLFYLLPAPRRSVCVCHSLLRVFPDC